MLFAKKRDDFLRRVINKDRQLAPQKLVTLKNDKSRTGAWRHSLYTSIPSFDEKYLRVCSCSVFNEQLFLRGLLNHSGIVLRGRVKAVCSAELFPHMSFE